MQGPWYTFEEAQELLSFNRSELLHEIDIGSIRPVVTTKQRSFLVFMRDVNKYWLGLGVCDYRGCLTLHPNTITTLLEHGEVNLNAGSGSFVEPHKVSNWNANYPFKQQPPFEVIKDWYGREVEDVDLRRCAVTPFPEERASNEATLSNLMNGFSDLMETITSSEGSSGQKRTSTEDPYLSELAAKAEACPATLDFKKNSLFKQDDLRIPASEIGKFNSKLFPVSSTQAKAQEIQTPRLSGKRINQLHELMFRALVANSSASTKMLWDIIKDDAELDAPLYDQDGIIAIMDATCIEWCSRNGIEQSLKWESFKTQVSKFRKLL